MAEWESNESRPGKKRGRHQNFLRVNDCLWKWYITCRSFNIPVSEPMLHEEAHLIAQKLDEDTMNMDKTGLILKPFQRKVYLREEKDVEAAKA